MTTMIQRANGPAVGLTRRRFMTTSTAAFVGAAAGLSPVAASSTQATTGGPKGKDRKRRQLYGFHQDLHYFGTSAPERVGAVASIGAQVSRSTLQWLRNEPEDGVFNWSGSDLVYDSLLAADIVPLWFVGRSPEWANGDPDHWVVPEFPSPEFDRWSDRMVIWVELAAERYPGCLWEVWNEPNEIFFWKPTPSPVAYSALYRKVREAILAGDPSAKVAVGGITGLRASCCLPGVEFIRQLIVNGDPIDHVGIHPYGREQSVKECLVGEQNFRDAADVRVMLTEAGNDAELWITEWGQNLGEPWQAGGEREQARYLWQGQSMIRNNKVEPCAGGDAVELGATVSTFFFDIDTANFPNHGVFTEDLEPKLAAEAFERFLGTL